MKSDGDAGGKALRRVAVFRPELGEVVRDAPGKGPGHWCGAAGAYFDDTSETFYLYYRIRLPFEAGRGIECRVASGKDGVHFEDIWTCHKQAIGAMSIEGGCLLKFDSGDFGLLCGFVDESDNRWKICALRASSPAHFDPSTRRIALDPRDGEVAGVKDPAVIRIGNTYHMLVSYHRVPEAELGRPSLTRLGDTIATGVGTSNSGLALSDDGINWTWHGDVLSPRPGRWDAFCARITGVFHTPFGFLAFYDGMPDISRNYEEQASLAWSGDLRSFKSFDTDAPLFTSPFSSGSVRYIEPLMAKGRLFLYYEFAREDGAHQLRVANLPLD